MLTYNHTQTIGNKNMKNIKSFFAVLATCGIELFEKLNNSDSQVVEYTFTGDCENACKIIKLAAKNYGATHSQVDIEYSQYQNMDLVTIDTQSQRWELLFDDKHSTVEITRLVDTVKTELPVVEFRTLRAALKRAYIVLDKGKQIDCGKKYVVAWNGTKKELLAALHKVFTDYGILEKEHPTLTPYTRCYYTHGTYYIISAKLRRNMPIECTLIAFIDDCITETVQTPTVSKPAPTAVYSPSNKEVVVTKSTVEMLIKLKRIELKALEDLYLNL
jgi:hypothetical protein